MIHALRNRGGDDAAAVAVLVDSQQAAGDRTVGIVLGEGDRASTRRTNGA